MLAVEADYAAREAQLQEEIDNIESSHPGYDEYGYDLGMIGHDPHELAAFLSAVLQGYTCLLYTSESRSRSYLRFGITDS